MIINRYSYILLLVFLALLTLVTVGCGGYYRGYADTGQWLVADRIFEGEWIGYRRGFDRNGNLRFNAVVERSCEQESDLRGSCSDQIHYHRNSGIADEKRHFEWQLLLIDDTRSELTIASTDDSVAFYLEGEPYLSSIFFNGRMPLPGSLRERSSSVRGVMQLQSGPRSPWFEEQRFFWFGLKMGSVETLWLRP